MIAKVARLSWLLGVLVLERSPLRRYEPLFFSEWPSRAPLSLICLKTSYLDHRDCTALLHNWPGQVWPNSNCSAQTHCPLPPKKKTKNKKKNPERENSLGYKPSSYSFRARATYSRSRSWIDWRSPRGLGDDGEDCRPTDAPSSAAGICSTIQSTTADNLSVDDLSRSASSLRLQLIHASGKSTSSSMPLAPRSAQ